MPELIAIQLTAGERFLTELSRAWERGDAVAPLDPAAPPSHTAELLAALRPSRLITEGDEARLDGAIPTEEGDALVMMTSGTSGAPKAVVHTRTALEAAAFASANGARVGPATKWLACLPLHHIGGFGVVSRALLTGARLEVHAAFDAVEVERAAVTGCTHTSLVPTTLARIRAELFEAILVGGSAIPADRPSNTIATYGSTETCGGIVYEGWPLNGIGVRIDAAGQIELQSPTLLRCYRDGTSPLLADGWYPTGDLGSVDPTTGKLSVAGRADDLIISGGENVMPGPVESRLLEHPEIAAVAVVGRPDPEWGHAVVAVAVPIGDRQPSLAELRDFVKARLPAAHAPKAVEWRSSLPRTSLGKVRRRDL